MSWYVSPTQDAGTRSAYTTSSFQNLVRVSLAEFQSLNSNTQPMRHIQVWQDGGWKGGRNTPRPRNFPADEIKILMEKQRAAIIFSPRTVQFLPRAHFPHNFHPGPEFSLYDCGHITKHPHDTNNLLFTYAYILFRYKVAGWYWGAIELSGKSDLDF